MPEERLQKVLAQAGLGSRRSCEELILAGRVTVDGRVVTELGTRVDPDTARITVDGKSLGLEPRRYVMLHKPAGYLSGPDPRAGYPSWQELVKVPERLYAVGRLDQDSEGLLLLTNDGELALRLTHPRYEHAKIYLVEVEGVPDERKIRRWQHGIMLDDGPTLPAKVVLLREPPLPYLRRRPARPAADDGVPPRGAAGRGRAGSRQAPRTSWLKITLREGRKRQIRRMVGLLGHPALRVIRIGMGSLLLGDLRPGKWRDLTEGEVRALRAEAFTAVEAANAEAAAARRSVKPMPSMIAIDGPSASGKSTIGGLLARELGYLYFDTGVMYRAVAVAALARGVPVDDADAVTALAESVRIEVTAPTVDDGRDVTVMVDGQDITLELRRPDVEKAVSPVSAYPGVREAMLIQQRRIGEAGRIVMVGRDIGTVVLPNAEVKVFLTATPQERARRRQAQLADKGIHQDMAEILADIKERDHRDSTRAVAPLKVAPGAIELISDGMEKAQVVARLCEIIRLAEEAA